MHAWEAIEAALDEIEEHLSEEIRIDELAEKAGLSPFYFQRLFKRLVKRPVLEYVKLRRLARVISELNDREQRIVDLAMDYGFSSHANFSRSFKEAYGITPEEYRKNRPRLNVFERPELSMRYRLIDEGVPLIAGDTVLEIERRILAVEERYLGLTAEVPVASQVPVGESTGIDIPGRLWNQFHGRKAELRGWIDNHIELGMSDGADGLKGTFTYFAGARRCTDLGQEISDKDGGTDRSIRKNPPAGFAEKRLPAGEYVVCRVEAENFEKLVTTALDQAGRYLFGVWLKAHKLETKPFSAEKYFLYAADGNGVGVGLELWVMPVPAV